MSRRALSSALIAALTLLAIPAALPAQTYIWTGTGETSSIGYSDNWQDGVSPSYNGETQTYGGDDVVLGFIPQANATRLTYNGSLSVFGLCFDDITQSYRIQGSFNDGGNGSLFIGAGGIDYKPNGPLVTQIYDSVRPTADQTWYVGNQGRLEIYGPLMESSNGAFTLTKTGDGVLALYGPINGSSYLGYESALNLAGGYLELRSNAPTALGHATLDFSGGTLFARSSNNYQGYEGEDEALYLTNYVVSHGVISTINEIPVYLDGGHVLSTPVPGTEHIELPAGGLTLAADTTIRSQGEPLYIESDIVETGGARKLTIDSTGAVILLGENSYTGGTHVEKGVLIFGDIYGIPEINLEDSSIGQLSSTGNGYIGFGDDEHGAYAQSYFIDTFDKANTHGTIGFDSDPQNEYANVFTGAIDLTGFASDARLGSATYAILTGQITPQGTDYRFGGGGGTLELYSSLVDVGGNSALVADSPVQTPLTLRLASHVMMDTPTEGGEGGGEYGNTFSGGVSATHSAIVFAYGALPTQIGANNWTLGTGGYIGYEGINYDAEQSPEAQTAAIADLIGRFQPTTGALTGVIGFNANPNAWSSRYIEGDIDLGALAGGAAIGTTTTGYQDGSWYAGVVLSGAITTANNGTDAYRFAGYKGGMLEVQSDLRGSAGVVIGVPSAPETFGDFIEREYSSVALTGNNAALTGDITFHGGRLFVGQGSGEPGADPSTALGTGTLIVQPFSFPNDLPLPQGEIPSPQLAAFQPYDDLVIANNIQLNTSLGIGGSSYYGYVMAFTGTISGSGGLQVGEDGDATIELHSANTFTGGVYIHDGSTLDLYDDHATGTGPVAFGTDGDSSGSLYFNTANPVIGGLASNEYAYLNFQEPDTTLTINQAGDSVFRGEFYMSEYGGVRIVKTGTGTLRLDDGQFNFNYGTFDGGSHDAIPVPGTEATSPSGPEIGLEVRQGTLVLGQDFDFTSSSFTIRVTGHVDQNPTQSYAGTLQVDDGKYIANPLILENGGRLAGNGNFGSAISVSDGAILSPGGTGANAISTLHFNHLELGGLGVYEWQVQGLPGSGTAVSDSISVYGAGTLVINATAESPFTIRVISLNSGGNGGILTGIDQSHGMYVWTLFNYDYLGGNPFDPDAFVIDTSAFTSDAPLDGEFTIFQENNQILLGFTPVPEPSTYALMALGLGFVVWSFRRRRA